jgi:NAD(P)-dependent dehydrogenase (short-subunit alcohol dehydrogenase family)
MRFESRTAVITGGAIGFGRAFARALVAEGASVVIADIDVDMAERTAAELVSAGGLGALPSQAGGHPLAGERSRWTATLPTPNGWMPLSMPQSNGSAASIS